MPDTKTSPDAPRSFEWDHIDTTLHVASPEQYLNHQYSLSDAHSLVFHIQGFIDHIIGLAREAEATEGDREVLRQLFNRFVVANNHLLNVSGSDFRTALEMSKLENPDEFFVTGSGFNGVLEPNGKKYPDHLQRREYINSLGKLVEEDT